MKILSVDGGPAFDESIVQYEYRTHAPYASTRYGNNDDIRIPIQQQDVFTLPAESFSHIEGKLTANNNTAGLNVKLINNAIAFLLEEIRYDVAGVELDRTKNVNVTSTVKTTLPASAERDKTRLINASWAAPDSFTLTAAGELSFCVPLKMLLGFTENYTPIF